MLYFDTQANDGVSRNFFNLNGSPSTENASYLLSSSSTGEGGTATYAFAGYFTNDPLLPTSVISG